MADAHLSSLILIGLCIILSAFFSSSEAAFLALERIRLVHLLNTNKPGAQRVAGLLERPERLLSTILLGNNLVNVAFTALITVVSLNLLGEGREALATILATVAGTVLLLIFGETIPKTIAVHQAERISFWYARPLKMLEIALLAHHLPAARHDELDDQAARRQSGSARLHHRGRAPIPH